MNLLMRAVAGVMVAVGVGGCARGENETLVTFSAMGDVPYRVEEEWLLAGQLRELPEAAAFVVHLGDIQPRQAVRCDEEAYVKVAGILRGSPRPVFIVPGDNEYNDCPNAEEAFAFWTVHFQGFEEHWAHPFHVRRQEGRLENFAFVHNRVLFVGINMLSGRVHDPGEWRRRHGDNVRWVEENFSRLHGEARCAVVFAQAYVPRLHEDFAKGFVMAAEAFARPVLYLQGDGHRWLRDRPFAAANVERVQVDMGGIARPVTVEVRDDAAEPFRFDRRMAGRGS